MKKYYLFAICVQHLLRFVLSPCITKTAENKEKDRQKHIQTASKLYDMASRINGREVFGGGQSKKENIRWQLV